MTFVGSRRIDDDPYSEESTIRHINGLFAEYANRGPGYDDQDVIITIRAKRSQVVIEECREPYPPPQFPTDPTGHLGWVKRYYRINLRNPETPPGNPIIEIKFPKRFSYYRLGEEPHATYYKQTEGRNRMQFFLPETGSWRESTYLDAEDYANRGGHGRMYEVRITDLPDSIQILEGDCE